MVGFVAMADGLGKQSVELIEELQRSFRISFISTRPCDSDSLLGISEPLKKIINTSGQSVQGRVVLFEDALINPPSDTIQMGFWNQYGLQEQDPKQVRIAYSMFESSKIPKGWVYALNNSFDAVAVPDEFLVKVYRDSGVKIPLFVVPLGTQLKGFMASPIKSKRGTPFVFATFGSCDERKAQLTLVQAFYKAFGSDPKVQLRLGWRRAHPQYREQILNEIKKYNMSNVVVEEGAVGRAEYIKRFLGVDCYVNLAIGEGFSLQPREAMALGIPVIISDNTAQTTICKSGLSLGVPATICINARYPFEGDFGVQYGCSVDDAARALRRMYRHYDSYVRKGKAARNWAAQYDYSALHSLYRGLIKPRTVRLGSKNKVSKRGITTTSRCLIKKYKDAFKDLRR